MLSSEKQLAIVKDIVLPLDINTRYDVYFTNKRVAIICLGRAHRFESEKLTQVSAIPSPFGMPAITSSYIENRQDIDQEIKNWAIDDLLKLSKKSCFYTHDEIEEVKLIAGHKPKFTILSKECESKFSPNAEQFKQLSEILPTIETLRNKISIAGNWSLLREMFNASFCKYCGSRNTLDVIYCQSCGRKNREEPINSETIIELTCSSCGAMNKMDALFCKQCGVSISLSNKK